jgi:hypothetical protein
MSIIIFQLDKQQKITLFFANKRRYLVHKKREKNKYVIMTFAYNTNFYFFYGGGGGRGGGRRVEPRKRKL